jgi:hypothetical protein
LTFGYYDKSKFKGEIHWNKVENQYMYGVQFEDLLFNGKSSGICKGAEAKKKCLITFDSAHSLMSMPQSAISFLSSKGVPMMNQVKKCKAIEHYGSMAYIIGGKEYKLENDEWMFPPKPIPKGSLAQGGIHEVIFKDENDLNYGR